MDILKIYFGMENLSFRCSKIVLWLFLLYGLSHLFPPPPQVKQAGDILKVK